MESFLEVMNVTLNGFNLPFTVYGFTLSWYDISDNVHAVS